VSFSQSRRHHKYPPQPLLQRDGFLGAKPGADPAAQAGIFTLYQQSTGQVNVTGFRFWINIAKNRFL
jgi:hypothetical protein